MGRADAVEGCGVGVFDAGLGVAADPEPHPTSTIPARVAVAAAAHWVFIARRLLAATERALRRDGYGTIVPLWERATWRTDRRLPAMWVLEHLADALRVAGAMVWTVLWPLTLGFLLSSVVATLVSTAAVSRVLGRDRPRSAALAALFGAASSSCSYAAVAVARTLFRNGATLSNAILFEFASTNLVFELGLLLIVLLGWQFFTAELLGGLLMVAMLAVAVPLA